MGEALYDMQGHEESRQGDPNHLNGPFRQRKKIILCFDGTGNKFSGTDADSNILKIYRMLVRNNGFDKHYYQPGIGTYVNTRSLSHRSTSSRVYSWYQKAKDSAVGTSFDEHVMGAYKFLMATYEDDDIFLFGFSRGAYVARFLAEMLDHVGLLSAGNEEMARFAWKSFAQWQERQDKTEEEAKKKKEMLTFLQGFRETFSRPVRRIRFMGLFDTVNSVPRFENAWMQRSKFPYSVRSSAKVIRHAVSIDERRAKFRSDLISETTPHQKKKSRRHHHHHHHNQPNSEKIAEEKEGLGNGATTHETAPKPTTDRFRRPSQARPPQEMTNRYNPRLSAHDEGGRNRYGPRFSVQDGQVPNRSGRPRFSVQDEEGRLMPRLSAPNHSRMRSISSGRGPDGDASSINSDISQMSTAPPRPPDDDDDLDEAAEQDIEELWFPGCHADLGGGWPLSANEESLLSHNPLVWMVREAQRAGLNFDYEKMVKLKCCDDKANEWPESYEDTVSHEPNIPGVQVTSSSEPNIFARSRSDITSKGWAPGLQPEEPNRSDFHRTLHGAATKGMLHDCLEFNNGLSHLSVLSWKIMEYLPFRRMDLKPDGSWEAISFPLPMSEPRDIPYDAKIHNSAIRRMEADENYRPGNLIIGGGGRGVKKAPKELGIGKWEIAKGKNDPVGEVYVRKERPLAAKTD
ncbi:hypothetical protein MMC29_008178 [Sticta canariensis]|nr:hypothetical protein [Sticta canariensis]